MHTFLLLFFLLLTCGGLALTAQSATQYIIAPSGLNLRAAPTAASPVLKRLAFGELIVLANDSIYAIDTLFTVANFGYYELMIGGKECSGRGDRPVVGHWRRVTSGNTTGYLVDTYLYPFQPGRSEAAWVYYDVHSTNWGLSIFPKDYNWYGIFAVDEVIKLQRVTPEFIYTESEFSGDIIDPVYDDLAISYGLLGSKKVLRERTLDPVYADRLDQPFASTRNIRFTQIGGDSITYGLNDPSTEYFFEAVNDSTGTRTVFRMTGGTGFPRTIRLQADLDDDGQEDYILFCYTTVDVYEIVLFLGRDRVKGVYQKSASCYQDFD